MHYVVGYIRDAAKRPQAGEQIRPHLGERAGGVTRGRRVLAGLLLAGWLAMLMVSAWTTQLQVCNDEVARVGGSALVKSCGSLSITDAPSLALLVVVGVLLFPDLTSLEIPGILRVERKLEEQAKQQDDLASMVQRLQLSVAQRVEVTNNNYSDSADTAVKVGELAAVQVEKREEFESPAS